jgi:30S ribosomal protein S31
MGRGDRRTRKGKTSICSYGNVRPHKIKRFVAPAAAKPAPVAAAAPAKLSRSKKSA